VAPIGEEQVLNIVRKELENWTIDLPEHSHMHVCIEVVGESLSLLFA